jgi:hypothetical protein
LHLPDTQDELLPQSASMSQGLPLMLV